MISIYPFTYFVAVKFYSENKIENKYEKHIEVITKQPSLNGCRYTLHIHGFRSIHGNAYGHRISVIAGCDDYEIGHIFEIK